MGRLFLSPFFGESGRAFELEMRLVGEAMQGQMEQKINLLEERKK